MFAQAPKEPSYATKLRTEADKRGLRFRVDCLGDEADSGFIAYAEYKNTPEAARYIEDGAKGQWIVRGQTQRETAMKLLEAIQGPPRYLPEHKPPPEKKMKMQCPEPIEGGWSRNR